MLFGQKQQFFSVNEIINSLLQDGTIKGRSGAVVLERREGRKVINTATLYFRNEAIYAADIKESPIPIALRIWTSKKVDEKALETIVNSCGSNSSPDIPRQVLNKILTTEENIENYIKEHFLENISEIFSWENCKGKWIPDQTTRDFTMPNASVAKLRMVVNSRVEKYLEVVKLLAPFFKENEIRDLVFVRQGDIGDQFSPEVSSILSLANGENTVNDIAEKTGIGRTNILQTLISLWEKDMIHVRYGAIELSYESTLAAHRQKENEEKESEIAAYEAEAVELQSHPVAEELEAPKEDKEDKRVFDESLMTKDDTDINIAEDTEEIKAIADLDNKAPESINTANSNESETLVNKSLDMNQDTKPEDSNEEKNHKKWESDINDVYSKFGINHIAQIDFDERGEDSIDIEPLYLEEDEEIDQKAPAAELPAESVRIEGSDSGETKDDHSDEDADKTMTTTTENEDPEISANKENGEKDQKAPDTNESEVSAESAVETLKSSNEENPTTEHDDLELDEEIELFESEGGSIIESVQDDEKNIIIKESSHDINHEEDTTHSPVDSEKDTSASEEINKEPAETKSLSFPDLVILLEGLQKESSKLDREISDSKTEQNKLDSEISTISEEYESISSLARTIDEECTRLSEEYKKKCEELAELHETLDKKEAVFNQKNKEMLAQQQKEHNLQQQKETILDSVEEATSHFRVR